MEEREILELFRKRSEQALEEVRGRFGARLFGIARQLLSDCGEAEECVDDCLLALWNAIPPTQPDSLEAYAVRIVTRLACSRYRLLNAQKRKAEMVSLDELAEVLPSGTELFDQVWENTLKEKIRDWIRSLPRENAYIFLHRYWYGESAEVIAKALGLNRISVQQRLSRMKRSLKRKLEAENGK